MYLQGEGDQEGHIPTFLYAFPFDENKVFIQETHLVARSKGAMAMSLQMEEMVRRLDMRIEHLGLKVESEQSATPHPCQTCLRIKALNLSPNICGPRDHFANLSPH